MRLVLFKDQGAKYRKTIDASMVLLKRNFRMSGFKKALFRFT